MNPGAKADWRGAGLRDQRLAAVSLFFTLNDMNSRRCSRASASLAALNPGGEKSVVIDAEIQPQLQAAVMRSRTSTPDGFRPFSLGNKKRIQLLPPERVPDLVVPTVLSSYLWREPERTCKFRGQRTA